MLESIFYRFMFLLILFLAGFVSGFGTDHYWMSSRFQGQRIELLEKAREIEQVGQAEQDAIIRKYTQQIRDMEERYAQDMEAVKTAQLRDVVPAPECVQSPVSPAGNSGLSAKAADKPRVACYTENQLRAKIENSLALARECDREMMRFQALIKACSHE